MRIGIFADVHDHLEHLRSAVAQFNALRCGLVLFAGDFVSTIAVPPLRRLACPVIASFGDNEGNKVGLRGGMQLVGTVGEPPFGVRAPDGLRILLTHQLWLLRGEYGEADVVVYAHTHRARIHHDEAGRLFINPGETSGWTYGRPTIAVLETSSREARIVPLCEPSPPVHGRPARPSATG